MSDDDWFRIDVESEYCARSTNGPLAAHRTGVPIHLASLQDGCCDIGTTRAECRMGSFTAAHSVKRVLRHGSLFVQLTA